MAIENSPKVRQRRELERKQAQRASHDRILIVSEGSRTEPNYFQEIRKTYRLCTANVAVSPSALGTAPIQVVEYAQELFEKGDHKKKIQIRAFERVYAVFDRDDHQTYYDALSKAKSLDGKLKNKDKQPISFKAIASVPSFELWLLLHYEDVQAALHRDEVMQRLKRHIPGYYKGGDNVYQITNQNLDVAIQRAEALAKRFTAYTDPEPFTAIVELVKLLTTLSS